MTQQEEREIAIKNASLKKLLIKKETAEGMQIYCRMYPGIDNPFIRSYPDLPTKAEMLRKLRQDIDWYNQEIDKLQNRNQSSTKISLL